MLLALYRIATHLGGPLIAWHLRRRVRLGKEDTARLGERSGKAGIDRPEGPLVWFHAASVGESLAALPLIETLLETRPALRILMTTGTVTSASLMADRLPARAIHQFVPVDRAAAWRRFLTHWRPDVGCLVESEIWPNLILQAEALNVPLIAVNGSMSARSFNAWRRAPATAASLFGRLELCLAKSDKDAERFRRLGAADVRSCGNLKQAALPLPVDEEALASLKTSLQERKIWLAASTHPGEEEQILVVHQALASAFPGLLTIIVPRHPERGDHLVRDIRAAGFSVTQRSKNIMPDPATELYLADSLGELGLFYRLTSIAFIGGSLVPSGGHNALEAARLGCALLFGPHTGNFDDVAGLLEQKGAAIRVRDADDLAANLARLFSQADVSARMSRHALAASADEGAVLDRVVEALMPLLDRHTQAPACRPSRVTVDACS